MPAERVCDYPRPPQLVFSNDHIRVEALGEILVDTRKKSADSGNVSPTHVLPATGGHASGSAKTRFGASVVLRVEGHRQVFRSCCWRPKAGTFDMDLSIADRSFQAVGGLVCGLSRPNGRVLGE